MAPSMPNIPVVPKKRPRTINEKINEGRDVNGIQKFSADQLRKYEERVQKARGSRRHFAFRTQQNQDRVLRYFTDFCEKASWITKDQRDNLSSLEIETIIFHPDIKVLVDRLRQ